ncbi:hypothetical protein B0I32_10513 [Nonomuraea fuscirosea]|uniref:AAA domain-containing protein n=1 Tax=Nonomuraea fuscirosea TaxID=1291556 RepID=A0A2T0N327_9ACTN|nr:hypothetical protein [Nonomuraea fuscirosea]PRX66573.1 hypothetical protein B0I32_10513 [Nonomuraea fuscirosea]
MTENGMPLESRISERIGVPAEDVRSVFDDYGVPLATPPARPRTLRLHRLRLSGVRTGSVYPGKFDTPLRFSEGLTGLVAANLRGKTSVLELITWCLRGSPRESIGVRHWLHEIDLDVEVAGQPMGFRLNLTNEKITSAVVLTGPDIQTLETAREPDAARQIVSVLRASSDESYAEQIQALMMDRLDLHPLVNSFQETGTQTHGWPVYFGAIYLPAGRDKALLGEVLMSGLPGRLLQVFLDLPSAAALTRVKTTADVLAARRKTHLAADKEAREQRNQERQQIEENLRQAQQRLALLGDGDEGEQESLTDLAAEAVRLSRAVAGAQDLWDELMQAHRRARAQRQHDAKLVNDVSESATARLLFHGLDPKACPRCDQEITAERRREESQAHACAVCSRLVPGDDDNPDDVIAEAKQRLEASAAAERAAKQALEAAEAELTRLSGDLARVQERLRRAEFATQVPARVAAREQVLRLEGALSVFPELPPLVDDPGQTKALKVLKTAVKTLEEDHETAAETLFSDLNREIVELGRRFGIDSLEAVRIDRAARLEVTKGGDRPKPFGVQSPGERLRLRIAVVIALLRVGAAHHVSTHPGLLLIDSPKAEEVQDLDIRRLLGELAKLAMDRHLQVLITTSDFELAHDVLQQGNIIEAPDGRPLW